MSRKDIEKVYENHVAPSFIFTVSGLILPEQFVLDIGSGGGFPGIINAILIPDSEFVLVDSTRKKVDFLKSTIESLGLENVTAVWSRVEDLAKQEDYRESFDCTTSRSVAAMNVLVRWSRPLLKEGGKCVMLKGGDLTNELAELMPEHSLYEFPKEWQLNEKLASARLVSVVN